jgi:lipopolysaccharide export system protein LptA
MRRNLSLIFIATLLMATRIFALPADNEQTMHIIANSSLFDYKKGVNTYEGQVKIDQGTSHLTANRVITHNNAQHKIEEAVAFGMDELAHYWTLPKTGDVLFHAEAKVIRFYPLLSIVKLEGNASIKQGENTFHGPVIIYNIKDEVVSAPATKEGPTTITIEPKQLKS